jgi:hypothetical protein
MALQPNRQLEGLARNVERVLASKNKGSQLKVLVQ